MKKYLSLFLFFAVTCGSWTPIVAQNETTPKAEIQVQVTDFEDNNLKGEQIIFEGQNSGKRFRGVSDKMGLFTVKIDAGDTYNIKVKSIGPEQDYNTLKIPSVGPGEYFPPSKMSIKLAPVKLFTLDNIYFDIDKASLKSQSQKELRELKEYLDLKQDVNIEISGHTDNTGSPKHNQELSLARARAVKAYLVKNGIDAGRISTKGYGAERPRDTNDTPEGRKNNRRTEVRVL